MLTDQDIQKLMTVFPTKEEVANKEDIAMIRKDFSDLQTAVDAYAKKADTYFQEKKWLHQIADKVGVQVEYL